MSFTSSLPLLVLVVVWAMQCAMFTAAWPVASQGKEEEEEDKKDALYDPDTFEGDILITPEEFLRYYGGPHTDHSGSVSVASMHGWSSITVTYKHSLLKIISVP